MSSELSGREVLAIDAGTQGVSVILWCPERKTLLGIGEAAYAHDTIPGLPEGHLEQHAHYWTDAVKAAMAALREAVRAETGNAIDRVAGIGVTGHMHCMVRKDQDGNKPFGCDMWNDPRGGPESRELTGLFGEHMPARWTACHILAGMRAEPDQWMKVTNVTVTSGSLVHDLSGEWVLGPGDASGMFGALDEEGQIDRAKLALLDQAAGGAFTPLADMVPKVIPAGRIAGRLHEQGSQLLGGLPVGTPIAAPEGDQQAALVGAAADENEMALSAGTSFAGNIVSRAAVKAADETFNVLHTPEGLTMLMVCARNGTVGFSRYVSGLCSLTGASFDDTADRLTDAAKAVPPDALGAELLPFFQGESVVGLPDARASIHGVGLELLSNPGLMARLLTEGPCMTMRYGLEKVKPLVGRVKRVIMSGGALKSKDGYAPQLFADILNIPVVARSGDTEGTAKGAAVLAAYMAATNAGTEKRSLAAFARSQVAAGETCREPRPEMVEAFNRRYDEFERRVHSLRARSGKEC